ncbi:MAG TPA: DUF6538 domain-containing protein, partial [Burkholderiaceae bacterium]|nr:DUF6538 domain-containing protein [Burkholderiaceae bacterium]
MPDVKKPPRCERRGGQWYYRRRVPQDLVAVLGFSEYRESLKTPDIEMARTRAALRDAEVAVELLAARRQVEAQQEREKPVEVATLSPDALRYIREAVRARTLQLDEQVRLSRPDEDGRFHYESTLADRYEESGAALSSGEVGTRRDERERITAALQSVGVSISARAPSWPEAAYRAVEGELQALEDIG